MDKDYFNCSYSGSFWAVSYWLDRISITATLSFYDTVTLLGHILFFVALFKEARKDPAFKYLMYSIASQTIEIIIMSVFHLTGYLTQLDISKSIEEQEERNGLAYRKIYSFMFFRTYVVTCLLHICITLPLYLSISMAADRLFILTNSARYHGINHKKHRSIALICSISISVLANIHYLFHYKMQKMKTKASVWYNTVPNMEYLQSSIGISLQHVCNGVSRIVSIAETLREHAV